MKTDKHIYPSVHRGIVRAAMQLLEFAIPMGLASSCHANLVFIHITMPVKQTARRTVANMEQRASQVKSVMPEIVFFRV